MPMLMKEMNYLDFQNEIIKTRAMLIPLGAFEVWGPHLPIGADSLVAEEIANRLSDKINWIVGPSVPVGYSESLYFPKGGTIYVSPEVLKNYVSEILDSLIETGVNRFCFVSPHLGNVPIVTQIATHLRKTKNIKCCLIDWWRIIQPLCRKEGILKYDGPMAHGHASEAGTSTFLYLRPDLVKIDRLDCVTPLPNEYPDIPCFNPTRELYPKAMIGDATEGGREKGELIVEHTLDRVVEFLKQWN